MAASRVLSRFLPVAEGDISVYESMRRTHTTRSDLEAAHLQSPGDGQYYDETDDVPDELLYNEDDQRSEVSGRREAMQSPVPGPSAAASPVMERTTYGWIAGGQRQARAAEDEDVPESLLLEGKGKGVARDLPATSPLEQKRARAEEQWKATQRYHKIHASRQEEPLRGRISRPSAGSAPTTAQPNPQADAMWMFTNASNLDDFLLQVYEYYVGHGAWSIILARILSMLQDLFLFSLFIFLTTCIDYPKIPSSKSTSEVLIPKCVHKASWFKQLFIFGFTMYWLSMASKHVSDCRRLFKLRNFYLHVLGISDADIQTVSWIRVVDGMIKVQGANITTANLQAQNKKYLSYGRAQQRLNAETIANRLMREANYYVALYNKDILDFTLPIPFLGQRNFYSKTLGWCIQFCLTNFIFDEQGSIRQFVLQTSNRSHLIAALRLRLRVAAAVSIAIAPFNIIRFCALYFARYYTEFTKNPASASARSWTPYAEWKIREFNELDHLFERRLRQAAPFANDYLKQFPKDKTDQICRFLALVSGALAAVLTLATLFDPELFLGFEVTPGRTAVFWLTILVGVFGVAHGALPDDHEVHDPVLHLKDVLMYTHYMPAYWKDRLHSDEVRSEFSALYQMKILIFLEEVLSLIVAPWILLRNTGKQSERLIDFFRESTVHVNGIGNQCNFAVFGLKKDLNAEDPATVLNQPDGLRDDYYGLKDDKMAASVQNFMHYYSHHKQGRRKGQGWQPPPAWPPMMSPPTIDEGREWQSPSDRGRHPSSSTMLDQAKLPSHSPSAGRRTTARPPGAAGRLHMTQDLSHSRQRVYGGPAVGGMTQSRLIAQDSDLQDFADADKLESDTEDEGTGHNDADNGHGVLGMLYQFSKAQAERGAGVNI
ncbi:APG9-domain-containing protein [Polychaeton citri CBS 116435]|uniref:Autophagy-related protein 9 n=1 Tax=Polychaeton citri CBS 116435 TaxID=1314669 RepID=A0A9P4QFP9_9PEZI|nr:APG9-domain-containing protein [Polychaeton citri CBS 116435]